MIARCKKLRTTVLTGAVAAIGLVAGVPAEAVAYEAATTEAGLTEQAALASHLHRHLIKRFIHPLGLFEPLRLDLSALPPVRARSLYSRMVGLDAAEGYAPEWQPSTSAQVYPIGRQHVLGWLIAGTVIENIPADRLRHHFFDPRTGLGLHTPDGNPSLKVSLAAVKNGLSSVRQLLAGAALDGNGLPAPDWVAAKEAVNELGFLAFLRAYEQAERAEWPAQRENALVEVLLSVGGMLGVLEQMGDPAYLRSDLQALLDGKGELLVTERFRRAGVPPAKATGAAKEGSGWPQRLRDLFADGKGGGLAEKTAQRCATTPLRCYTNDAPELLAEAGDYGKQLIDYLFRGELRLVLGAEGQKLEVLSAELPLGAGTVTLLGEKPEGQRRVLRTAEVPSAPVGGPLAQFTITGAERQDLHRLVVLFSGRDRQNEPIVTSAQVVLPRPSGQLTAP